MDELASFYTLGVSLAMGLLIGLERGWHEREQSEGHRVAGIRTYALIGLLGGVWGLLSQELGHLLLAVAFTALAIVLVAAHAIGQRDDPDIGITGVIAGLLTFAFGAMSALDLIAPAAAGAVITTLLLGIKPTLHDWVAKLERRELLATLKLLLISVVILPLLPDEGYGPWSALNPYRIWWMVVIIASISFAGYFAMKIIGERKGILFTGLFAGLASSTAVTLNFSRLAQKSHNMENVLSAGILVACATMFPRILVVSSIFSWTLATTLLAPILAMALVTYAAAWLFWRREAQGASSGETHLKNPFELRPALSFAVLLALIMLLSRALSDKFGDTGIYLLAAFSGVSDVDAITLSLADMAGSTLSTSTAALAILIASFANSMIKAGLSLWIGGAALGARVGLSMLTAMIAGYATWWFVS
ncbi:MAG: MgtC/SapB family protein [Thioalkalivibrio sp.]